jgi:hypothetical protein
MEYLFQIAQSLSPESPPLEQVRRKSKILFGNSDRVQVADAIHRSEDGAVNATDLASELDLPNPRVRAQLLAFAEAGLLTPHVKGPGKHWYLRAPSMYWAACHALMEDRLDEHDDRSGHISGRA